MIVFMRMRMGMRFASGVCVLVLMFVFAIMTVFVVVREVDIELDAADLRFLAASGMKVVAVELELLQFRFECGGIHAEIQQRADEHVAADAAEDVEIKSFHVRN